MKDQYTRLNVDTSQDVLRLYQSRKSAIAAELDQRRLPQLYALG
jgi:hypothetical protein